MNQTDLFQPTKQPPRLLPAACYEFVTDGGHGWLRVPRFELDVLGITDDITAYSYRQGDDVLLEEDVDLATYARARFPGDWHGIDREAWTAFMNGWRTTDLSERPWNGRGMPYPRNLPRYGA